MPQIREIKRRIRSIENTSKVTHAMELVAAAKMRKSQEKALMSRPYTNSLQQIISSLEDQIHERAHQLLYPGKGETQMIILISSDRGLVGGLNLNIFRQTSKYESKNTKFVTVGKKASQFAARSGLEIVASFFSDEQPFIDLARTLTKLAIDSFVTGEVNSIFAIYPQFESTIKQIPTIGKILPIDLEQEAIPEENTNYLEPLFEPAADIILESILPHHVLTRIYQTLLEAKACEHSARMVTMKNATDAAGDLVSDLTLTYNQARQEAITNELLDIITAQSALE